jgi:hypothetical protein
MGKVDVLGDLVSFASAQYDAAKFGVDGEVVVESAGVSAGKRGR